MKHICYSSDAIQRSVSLENLKNLVQNTVDLSRAAIGAELNNHTSHRKNVQPSSSSGTFSVSSREGSIKVSDVDEDIPDELRYDSLVIVEVKLAVCSTHKSTIIKILCSVLS